MELMNSINILGHEYDVSYSDNTKTTDVTGGSDELVGSVNIVERKIRLYKKNRKESDLYLTLFHEMLHVFAEDLSIDCLKGEANHDDLDRIAFAFCDTLIRNDMLKLKGDENE